MMPDGEHTGGSRRTELGEAALPGIPSAWILACSLWMDTETWGSDTTSYFLLSLPLDQPLIAILGIQGCSGADQTWPLCPKSHPLLTHP